VRVAADDERLPPQGRIFQLFDRGEEGVQVEVGDDHPAAEPIWTATNTA